MDPLADALRHAAKWLKSSSRNCLIIPKVAHCGLAREPGTEPEVPFRRLSCHLTRALDGGSTIYQTVSLSTSVNRGKKFHVRASNRGTRPPAPAPAGTRDPRRKAASQRTGKESALPVGREEQRGTDVLSKEVREVGQDLLLRHPGGHILQDVVDRDPRATNGGITLRTAGSMRIRSR
jgi:hypothetical protein